MSKKISVANLVMLAGGVVTLLFSFFGFFDYGSETRNAWSGDAAAWISTVPAFLAIAMIVWCVMELAGQKLPAQVLTFNSNQLKATWGLSAAGLMIAWLATDFGVGVDKAIGFWFMLIGSLAMGAGSVMALLGKGTEMVNLPGGTAGSSAPPPPPPMSGGAPPPPPPG